MPQSLSQILLHVIFSTEERTPWLELDIRPSLYGYIAEVVGNEGNERYRIGGVEDHVHLAVRMKP
jgi:hypothetical protein